MVNKMLRTLLIALLIVSLMAPASSVLAARDTGPVVIVDLSHGEASTGLDTLFKIMPEFQWIVLVPSEEDAANLPPVVQVLAKDIWVGTFADIADMMDIVDGIIIGQPAAQFTPDEIAVIANWFYSDSNKLKFLWLAGDSDYPAQGGNLEIAQSTINAILEELGAQLRHDYVSVEDPVNYAKKTYRVIGMVEPDELVGFLAAGAQAVLFHGPGAIAYVDENGEWRSLSEGAPQNVFRIVWTSDQAYIVEHQPAQQGAPGSLGMAYTAGDVGKFVLMAAELMLVPIEDAQVPRIIIVSGETPYGGYQPMITYMYKGYKLDGPRFVRNVLLWASGVMGELKEFFVLSLTTQQNTDQLTFLGNKVADLNNKVGKLEDTVKGLEETLSQLQGEIEALKQGTGDVQALQQALEQVQAQVSQLQQALNELQNALGGQNAKFNELGNQIDQLSQQLSELKQAVDEAKAAAEQAPSSGMAMAGAVLGLVAIIIAALALARKQG